MPQDQPNVVFFNTTALLTAAEYLAENTLYVRLGDSSLGDGSGGLHYWSPSSTATVDSPSVIRPDTIDNGQPGRFIAIL